MNETLRKRCLELSYLAQDGNLQSVFSSIDLIAYLYGNVMDVERIKRGDHNRDLFVLSKGQSTLALHVVLESLGFYKAGELDTICQLKSRFSMQADRTKFERGIEISAGSLGHGLPMAVGMAMANKINKCDGKVYCLIGDGELNEGTMWEVLLLAEDKKLDNLYIIVDFNHSIYEMLNFGDLKKKLCEFGCECIENGGHDESQIRNGFLKLNNGSGKPKVMIAETVRGYGSRTLMDNREWFHKAPNEEQLKQLIEEVNSFEKSNG